MLRVLITLGLGCGFVGCADPPPAVANPAQPQAARGYVRVAGIVLKWLRADKDRNLARLEEHIRAAAANGAQIVLTTEGAIDGYTIGTGERVRSELDALAEMVPNGPHLSRLAQLARELELVLVVGLLERGRSLNYNAAVLLGPDGEIIGSYHKRKLGFEAGFNQAGESAPVFATPYGDIGVLICADRTVPRYALELARARPDFLLCPSGGFFGAKNDRIVRSRSRETHLPLVFVHPVEFLVTGRRGEILQRALLGDALWIEPHEMDSEADSSGVFYIDLPID